jgi:hypothetical protein
MSDESSIVALREVLKKAKARGRATARRQTQASWLDGWQIDSNGQPLANLFNALMALRADPAVSDILAYDEMLSRRCLCVLWSRRLASRRGL